MQFEHIIQQSFAGSNTVFNPDWATNGWFANIDSFDLTTVTTELRS